MHDPPVRTDGRCATSGCAKKLPRNKDASRYAGGALERDPFCSTRCCRVHYGTAEPETKGQVELRERGERVGRAASSDESRRWNKALVSRAIVTNAEKWHGTENGYKRKKCRCPKCTAAHVVACRRERERRAAKKATA